MELTMMMLRRFIKGIVAAALAGVILKTTELCGFFPALTPGMCVPLMTGVLLAIEKWLSYSPPGGKPR